MARNKQPSHFDPKQPTGPVPPTGIKEMTVTRCLICENKIAPFVSFGPMPIANGFLLPEQFDSEYRFELRTGFCSECGMVQLLEQPERERMFHDQYAFFSQTSAKMQDHFQRFARDVQTRYLRDADPFVLEIGSNDGILLRHFAQAGIRHMGVEPSANVAQVATEQGVQTVCRFFDEALAEEIIAAHGQADVIMSANVLCHIPYLHSVFAGIKRLLKPCGVLVYEDPYLGDIVEKTSYDQVYDEHAFYFSAKSVSYLTRRHGLELVDVFPQKTHGGSMRYVIGHHGVHAPSQAVRELMAQEDALGLGDPATYERLAFQIERSRTELVALLTRLKAEGKRVVGYGATSKSTTILNYCGIGPDLIEFISDTTPIKQGKFTPGAHIPVKPYDAFKADYPDFALLFAWNHAEEIMAKEEAFVASGGRFIVHVPQVRVLEPVAL